MPDCPERQRRIAALADIPQPLDGFLAERVADTWQAREPMLEVLARWHYGLQDVRSLRTFEITGRPYVACDYTLEIQPSRLSATTAVVTVGLFSELVADGRLPSDLRTLLTAAPQGHVRVADLYLTWNDAPATADERSAALHAALTSSGVAVEVRRIVVGVAAFGPDGPRVEYFTFRRRMATGTGQFEEDTLVRGVHPLVGRRLHLWRLQNFHVTRVSSPVPDGVLLFHCVARDNPDDQRLVALAQVHRFEVTRDASGQISGVEDAETVLAACADAIGRARQDLDPADQWLDMNHVWLDIRPVVGVAPDDLAAWQRATAPQLTQAGIQEVLVQGRLPHADGTLRYVVIRLCYEPGQSIAVSVEGPPTRLLAPQSDYEQKVLRAAAGTRYTRTSWRHCWPARRASSPSSTCGAPGWPRPGGHPGTTPPGSRSVSSPRRRRCIPRASGGWCCSATRPGRWARCQSPSAPASSRRWTWPSGRTFRWSGSPCRPERASPWIPAPRTWTGSPGRYGASSSSPRPAARSTSWSRASTSARSRTGTPRPPCSCTPGHPRDDPGYYDRLDPQRQTRNKIRELERLNPGMKVTLATAAA